MAGGTTPGPTDDLGPPVVIDEGTLARTDTSPPGPIGLSGKGGTSKTGTANLGDQVAAFARGRIGQRVGSGECFDLADQALRNAGARSAADFGTVAPDANYIWGSAVSLAEVQPGDIIQFRNYRYDRSIHTETSTEISDESDFQERPHHTAIVDHVDGNGAITVLEQNAPVGSAVQRTQLFFSNNTTSSGGRTTTVTVQGTFTFYRAQAR